MRKLFNVLMMALMLSAFIYSCDEGPKPIEINGLDTYTDEITGFSIKYPSNWSVQSIPGQRFVVFSSSQGQRRFFKYDSEGLPAAKIDVMAIALDSAKTIDDVIANAKIFGPEYYSTPEKLTIDGAEASKITYSFTLEDGEFNGMLYAAAKDTGTATVLVMEAFGGAYKQYKDKFDEIAKSLILAKTPAPVSDTPDTVFQVVEAEPASPNLTLKKGKGFSIRISDNFSANRTGLKGAIYSINYSGDRRADCNIQVDVLDASKQNKLDKIVADNRAKYKNAKPRDVKIGGVAAKVMDYSFSKAVKSRVYFVVKNDKLYRITVNWFTGEEKDYLPVFEKSIKSFKFQ